MLKSISISTSSLLFLILSHAAAAPQTAELTPEEQQLLEKMVGQGKQQALSQWITRNAPAARSGSSRARKTAETPSAGQPTDSPAAKPPTFTTLLTKQESDVPQYSRCAGLIVLLRQDWQDVGFASCPDTVDKAVGAQISYSDDRVQKNTIWSVHGTAAILYSSVVGTRPDVTQLYSLSAGGYVTVDRVVNSSRTQKKSNVDATTVGGILEMGFTTPEYWTHYFRVRGGFVQDDVQDVTSVAVTGEYVPSYPFLHIHEPFQPFGAPIITRFDPSFLVQYNSVVGDDAVLNFNGRTEALRIGPQLTVKLFPLPGESGFISRLVGSLTYHWAYEVYSGRPITWFQSAITYNIDDAGHLGLTASYQRGRDEDTGERTNLFKLSLTGKI